MNSQTEAVRSLHWVPALQLPDCTRQKDVCLGAGVVAAFILTLGLLGSFYEPGSGGFIASISTGGTVVLLSTGAFVFFVRKEKSPERVFAWRQLPSLKDPLIQSNIPELSPHPLIGLIEFAEEELRNHPDVQPYVFTCVKKPLIQPTHRLIAPLTTLFFAYNKQLWELNKTRLHIDPELLALVDKTMRLGYVISCLALEDLPATAQKVNAADRVSFEAAFKRGCEIDMRIHKGHAEETTYRDVIQRQDCYIVQAFYFCTKTYHDLRNEIFYDPQSTTRFYGERTHLSIWRTLYNDFRDRALAYVPADEFRKEDSDSRLLYAIQKDDSPETFRSSIGTVPT